MWQPKEHVGEIRVRVSSLSRLRIKNTVLVFPQDSTIFRLLSGGSDTKATKVVSAALSGEVPPKASTSGVGGETFGVLLV